MCKTTSQAWHHTPSITRCQPASYPRYVSPNPDKPNLGVLAADAVRVMARYIQNYVNHTEGIGALKLEPPGDLSVPALRTYVYIPVTGQIISRRPTSEDQEPQSTKKKSVATGSSASTPQKVAVDLTPSTPASKAIKRKLQLDKEEEDEDDMDDGDDDEVEDDAAAELEMLDQLEKASSGSQKKKKKNRPAKTTGGHDGQTK